MKLFQQIASLLLAGFIFVSNTGFKVEKFYCGPRLNSIHLFTSPDFCCSLPNTAEGCCHTEIEYFKSEFDSETPPATVELLIQLLVTALLVPLISLIQIPVWEPDIHIPNYKPPPLLRDIPVFVQSFLI